MRLLGRGWWVYMGKACESCMSSLTCLTCRNPDNAGRRWPKISCGALNKNTRNAERVATQLFLPACMQHHQLVDVPVDRFKGVSLKRRDCFEAWKQKERNILSSVSISVVCCIFPVPCSTVSLVLNNVPRVKPVGLNSWQLLANLPHLCWPGYSKTSPTLSKNSNLTILRYGECGWASTYCRTAVWRGERWLSP